MREGREGAIRYASERDMIEAWKDSSLYGMVILRRDAKGLVHRVDPTTVEVYERGRGRIEVAPKEDSP